MDGYALDTPLVWLQGPCKLTMFVLSGFDERDGLSNEAIAIFNRLYATGDGTARNRYMAQPIYGPVIIGNESDDEIVDLDMDDYRSLMSKVYDNWFDPVGVDALYASRPFA